MAVTINWATKVINIPKLEDPPLMTQIQFSPSPEIWELNVNTFRLRLKDIEDDVEGQPFTNTHIHNTEVTLAGLTLARTVEIIAPYTITFEDGQYAVNLVGANNNIADRLNVNQVSVRTSNSAGMVSLKSVWDEQMADHLTVGTTGKRLNDAGSAGNPWSTTVSGNTDPGTFGELVGKKLLTIAKFLGLK